MKKLSLVSVAVAATLLTTSWSASAAQRYNVTDSNPNLDSATISGIIDSGRDYLSSTAKNGHVGEVFAEPSSSFLVSYIKMEGKSETLTIDTLTLRDGEPTSGLTITTIEFWGKDNQTAQSVSLGTVNVGKSGVVRIQEGIAGSDSSNVANPKSSSVAIGTLNLGDKSAVTIGVSSGNDHQSPDSTSISTINVSDGEFAGIVAGEGQKNRIEVGTINIANNKLDLGNQTSLSNTGGLKLAKTRLVGQNGTVKVNLENASSQLVLGDVGEEDEGNGTTLDIKFSEAAAASKNSTVTVVKDAIVASNATFNVTADNMATGDAAQNIKNLQTVADKVVQEGADPESATTVADNVTLKSKIFDEVSAQIKDGKVDTNTIRVSENAEVVGFAQLHSVGLMQWRSEMNHMQYRLGEIRDHKGYNNGVWVRAYNGKDKYGSQSVENEYIGIQAGYDHRIEGTNFIVGGAVNYAHGDSDFSAGAGDNHNVAFTAYGTWLADSGLFADVTAKVGRLSNDVTIGGYTAGYDTNAVSLSAEAGWRVPVSKSFYVEPQVEMMYGHVSGADYSTQNYKAEMDAVDMFVGRLGVQAGLVCPQNKGSVYVRASVLHDFDGEASTLFRNRENLNEVRPVEDDLGGTWYELGIGAHYNVTDTTYVYADFQYADGDETESPWRWTLGIRKAF